MPRLSTSSRPTDSTGATPSDAFPTAEQEECELCRSVRRCVTNYGMTVCAECNDDLLP